MNAAHSNYSGSGGYNINYQQQFLPRISQPQHQQIGGHLSPAQAEFDIGTRNSIVVPAENHLNLAVDMANVPDERDEMEEPEKLKDPVIKLHHPDIESLKRSAPVRGPSIISDLSLPRDQKEAAQEYHTVARPFVSDPIADE